MDRVLEGDQLTPTVVARVRASIQAESPLPCLFDVTDLTHLPAFHPLRAEIEREG